MTKYVPSPTVLAFIFPTLETPALTMYSAIDYNGRHQILQRRVWNIFQETSNCPAVPQDTLWTQQAMKHGKKLFLNTH